MNKLIFKPAALLVCGGLIGYSIHLWISSEATAPETNFTTRTSQHHVEKLTQEEAQKHRESRFESLITIDDTLSLPSEFDQTDALYALAGRSDTDTVEQLIADASQLTHSQNRLGALQILMSRYAELEPQKALALLRKMPQRDAHQLTRVVYHHWAKIDINSALAAALNEPDPQLQQQAAHAIFSAWQDDDPDVLDQINQYFSGKVDFSNLQIELLAAQATYSPEAAMEQALELQNQMLRQQAISRTATVWAQNNPEQAYNYALNIADNRLREAALSSVFAAWSQTTAGAEKAFKMLAQSKFGLGEQRRYMSSILGRLTEDNPEQAFDLANQLPSAVRQEAYRTIMQRWAQYDVRAVMAKLDDLQNPNLRQQVQYSVVYQYANQYPQEALDWALQKTGGNRHQLLSSVLSQIAGSDPELALNTVLSMENPAESMQMLNSVLSSVAASDPQLAASYINELPNGRHRQQALRSITSQWVNNDPDGALEWASSLEGRTKQLVMQQIGPQLSHLDPDKAESLLPQLSDSVRQYWTQNIASAKARTDPQQAAEWAQQFSADRNYPQLVQSIAGHWASQDPLAALDYISEMPEGHRPGSVSSIVSVWARTDVQAAADWLTNNASSDVQKMSANQIAWQWASQDVDGAIQWASSLESSDIRDNALSSLARTAMIPTDRTFELVNSIEDKRIRNQSISSLFYRQMAQDRDGAQALLDHPDLDPDLKKTLEETFNKASNSVQDFMIYR